MRSGGRKVGHPSIVLLDPGVDGVDAEALGHADGVVDENVPPRGEDEKAGDGADLEAGHGLLALGGLEGHGQEGRILLEV